MSKYIVRTFICFLSFVFVFSVEAQDGKQKELHITATVTDGRGRYAGGLTAQSFQIAIDEKRPEIISVEQNVPATIVFLIDLSRSQKGTVAPLLAEIKNVIKDAHPDNEYTFIAFNTKPQLVLERNQDFAKLEESINKVLETPAKGETAFYDSVYAAIEKADSGSHQKKILICLSDGVDNASQSYKKGDVSNLLKESDVLFYAVNHIMPSQNTFDLVWKTQEQGNLFALANFSGGKSFVALTALEASEIFKQIALELKSQYRISLRAANSEKPDKWQEIKIKVEPVIDENKKIKLTARTRSGIYLTSAK